MNKENLINLLQSVLVVLGGYLIGDNLLGNEINQVLWMGIVGIVLTIVGFIWDIATTKVTLEYVQTTLMGITQFVGGLLIAGGKLSLQNAESFYGLVASLVGLIYPLLSRNKTAALANGDLPVSDLKGANDEV